MTKLNKAMLLILDGWGKGKVPSSDAILQANTPNMDNFFSNYPHSELITFGEDVGLPDGQMGNSEVGHLNLGAGRIVYQELARINKAVREKTISSIPEFKNLISYVLSSKVKLHLIGLVSDGGVHSHIRHLMALVDLIEASGIKDTFIHAFTDGRDVDPKSGKSYLGDLQNFLEGKHTKIASVIGRFYAMDRDNRWERIKLAYDLLVHGLGNPTDDIIETMEYNYAHGVTDEFIKPIYVRSPNTGMALATIENGDAVLFFNFRTDRPRELTSVLCQKEIPESDMEPLNLHFVSMTNYDESFENVQVLFKTDNLKNTIGEVLEKNNKTQVRIAETEKYPHVTFFFSGGREQAFAGEKRILIPSPKVLTYDLQPEMSAAGITLAILGEMNDHGPDFICLNFANTDMVGHTGVFTAAMTAAETVDQCLGKIIPTAIMNGYHIIIIADHGNADYMINEDGSPNTAHTKNPVPCIYIGYEKYKLMDGKLADLAPTILKLLEVPIPAEMTGEILLNE